MANAVPSAPKKRRCSEEDPRQVAVVRISQTSDRGFERRLFVVDYENCHQLKIFNRLPRIDMWDVMRIGWDGDVKELTVAYDNEEEELVDERDLASAWSSGSPDELLDDIKEIVGEQALGINSLLHCTDGYEQLRERDLYYPSEPFYRVVVIETFM